MNNDNTTKDTSSGVIEDDIDKAFVSFKGWGEDKFDNEDWKEKDAFIAGAQLHKEQHYLPLLSLCRELKEALDRVAKWDLPETGKFWDKEEKKPMSYEAAYGSNGARDYIKDIAKQAIKKANKLLLNK